MKTILRSYYFRLLARVIAASTHICLLHHRIPARVIATGTRVYICFIAAGLARVIKSSHASLPQHLKETRAFDV